MNFHFKHPVWTVLLMLLVAAQAVYACGVNWSLPKDHFDGVNERGYVSIWDQIGELDLGEDLKIPLITGFDSKREWSSPHVGHGFVLALLDSRFEQVDEGTFHMLQPDGWTTVFRRERKNKNILGGQGGWKAEIGPETITAYASCGWKLVYRQGKIESIGTPKNETLNYIYAGNRVSEIRCQGKVVLEVKTDPMSGMVTGLVAGSKQINLKQGQRPQVQRINGQNLVGAVSSALSEVVQSDNQTKSYAFAVDEKRFPTLTLNKDRVIAWDPETKRIMRDGGWIYQITPNENPQFYAGISRTNSQKQSEFWHLNGAKGKETVQTLDGTKTVKTWFISGKLCGKTRSVERFDKSNTLIGGQYFTYDENGRILRLLGPNDQQFSLKYTDSGEPALLVLNNRPIWSKND